MDTSGHQFTILPGVDYHFNDVTVSLTENRTGLEILAICPEVVDVSNLPDTTQRTQQLVLTLLTVQHLVKSARPTQQLPHVHTTSVLTTTHVLQILPPVPTIAVSVHHPLSPTLQRTLLHLPTTIPTTTHRTTKVKKKNSLLTQVTAVLVLVAVHQAKIPVNLLQLTSNVISTGYAVQIVSGIRRYKKVYALYPLQYRKKLTLRNRILILIPATKLVTLLYATKLSKCLTI